MSDYDIDEDITDNEDNIDLEPMIILTDENDIFHAPDIVEQHVSELDKLNDLINIFRNSNYPDHLLESLIKLRDDTASYNELDHALISLLKDLSSIDNTPIYQKNQYSEIVNKIDETSFVIYFKRAGIFKVYPPNTLQQYMHGQVASYPELRRDNEIYEVVSKKNPQKIIIIIDGSIEEELTKIRDYVFEFFSKYNGTLDKKDILSFKNPITKNLEILVNGMYVKNYEDKEILIRQLLDYIEEEERKKKYPLDIGKIEPRRLCEIPGADMFLIPQKRDEITKTVDTLLSYVSNINGCKLIGGNTININIINSNNTNSNIGNTETNSTLVVHESEGSTTNDIDMFIDHIKENEPDWYVGGKWIFINVLYEHFVEICGLNINKNTFSKIGMNKLFTKRDNKYMDKKKGRAVLLIKIDKL